MGCYDGAFPRIMPGYDMEPEQEDTPVEYKATYPVEVKPCETCAVVDVAVEMTPYRNGPVQCAVCREMTKVTAESHYFQDLAEADRKLEQERIAEKKRILGIS